MSDKPVVVYGASGYTGRLICEYLRELNVPFVAAGRDKDRCQDVVGRIPGIAGYSGTKSAVDRMTRIAAAEAGRLGYGVRVNCIYPGLVPTAMGMQLAVDCAELGLFESPEAAVGAVVGLTPSGRLGEVADMADAVVFLASDAARFITGAGLPVDGGMGS